MKSFSLASARDAAVAGETATWIGEFLSSRGSDNEILAAALALKPHWWVGPIQVDVDDLVRLAGPEADALVPVAPGIWEDDVETMHESLEKGWEPPPLLAEYRDGRLLLQDGNHRYEALVRAGAETAWVLVFFDDEAQRDAFESGERIRRPEVEQHPWSK